MEINSRVILKITTDYVPLINHANHYISLYNHLYSEHIQGNIYFEIIANGILAIYSSYDTFIALIAPKKFLRIKSNLNPNFIIQTIAQQNFPLDGLKITIECIIPDKLEILNPLILYYQRISPHIQISSESDKKFMLYIKNYQGFLDYINYLFINFPNH